MKNSEVIQLNNKISSYIKPLKDLKGAKFSYALIKNTELLQKEVKDIAAVITPTEAYQAYDKARVALCESFAKKDEKGNVIRKNLRENGQFDYDIDVNDEAFKAAVENLKEEHKDAIKEQDEKILEYNKFLDEESTVSFHKISISDVPNDISVELMSVIEPFIQ